MMMAQIVQTAFLTLWNNHQPADEVGRCSEIQFFFRLACGCHFTYTTPRSITNRRKRPRDSGLRCRICDYLEGRHKGRPISQHEVYAWAILHARLKCRICVEIKVLGKQYGAADIWLPFSPAGSRIDLVIMIDGEHHFHTKWDDVEHQQAVDNAFNVECWRQEHRLLRLCFHDKHEWAELIDLCVTKAEIGPHKKFQMLSSHYVVHTGHVNREADMDHRHHRKTGAYFEGH